MNWQPADNRYETMIYNRCGRSGLKLPAISLGLWHNFGGDTPHETKRAICRKAFDLGITHFDLANNYGPPPGSAETAFGEILRTDFAGYRDELIISTKAGYDMWPGPYGEWGSRKYLLASLDQSLKRHGPRLCRHLLFAPLRPRHAARGDDGRARPRRALRQGALCRHLVLQFAAHPRGGRRSCSDLGTPCLIHQPSYSMINRWVEDDGLLDTLEGLGVGSIVFSPLAQGMLTDKYLERHSRGQPRRAGQVAAPGLPQRQDDRQHPGAERASPSSAARRWRRWRSPGCCASGRVTSALIGASRPEQVEDCVGALKNLDFSDAELAEIDNYAREADINLWAASAGAQGPARGNRSAQ